VSDGETRPISITEYLGETLSTSGPALKWDEVTRHIRSTYLDSAAELARMEMHRRRHDLYNDAGGEHLSRLIELVFQDPEVKRLRHAWEQPAQYNNVLKRVVNELSTCYSEPANRTVTGAADQLKYFEVQTQSRQHEQFRVMEQLLNLHRAVWVGFRVRNVGTHAAPRNDLKIDIVTPAASFIITHPNDPTVPIGLGIRIDTSYALTTADRPAWVVWTEAERFLLDRSGRLIGAPVTHGIVNEQGQGVLPYVYVTLEPPRGTIWPGRSGEDLVSADLAIKFASVCLLKELKSATRQTWLTGDLAAAARDQTMDTEATASVPEGVQVQTVDMSMDLATFRDAAEHILETVANNYGMSAAYIHQQGVQSADARDLMRVPLRELRIRNQLPLRVFERAFVDVQTAVLRRDLPELAFSSLGWSVDFADPQTPRSPKEAIEELELARRVGVMSTIEWLVRRDPSLTREQAEERVAKWTEEELWRNEIMRPLQEISGSFGAEMRDGLIGGRPKSDEQTTAVTNTEEVQAA
jgi:hypothetical protein